MYYGLEGYAYAMSRKVICKYFKHEQTLQKNQRSSVQRQCPRSKKSLFLLEDLDYTAATQLR